MNAESEPRAATAEQEQIEAVVAKLDGILSDETDGRVRRVVDVHRVEDHRVVELEVEEDIDGEEHQTSRWLVAVDQQGRVVDLDRLTDEQLAGGG